MKTNESRTSKIETFAEALGISPVYLMGYGEGSSVVGPRIKALRKKHHLSAEELAAHVGCSPATMYRYEKGDIRKIPPDVLDCIADLLGVGSVPTTPGQRIKSLRRDKGLTQEELGAAVGVQKGTINKYETGVVVNIKPAVVQRLAEVLETTPAHLMGYDAPAQLPHPVEYDKLTVENRNIVDQVIRALAAQQAAG